MAAGPFANGFVAFACSQAVSESVWWLQVLLLMVLWHLPALRKQVNQYHGWKSPNDGIVVFAFFRLSVYFLAIILFADGPDPIFYLGGM